MKKIFLFFLLILFSYSVFAVTIKGHWPICLTRDLYDQIMKSETDQEYQYLLKNGCLVPQSGLKITVLERDLSGRAKIRIFFGEEALIGWTYFKNIQRPSHDATN